MKTRNFQLVVESVVNSPAKKRGDFLATAELIADALSEQLAVDCISIWAFDNHQSLQYPICLRYLHDTPAVNPALIRPKHLDLLPHYLEQLYDHRLIVTNDIATSPCSQDLATNYFMPRGVVASLDVSVRINGHLEGVICLERMHSRGAWQEKETNFVCQLADQLALTLATQQSYQQQELLTLFRSALAQSDQITMLVDLLSLTISYVNRAHGEITGTSANKVIGNQVSQLSFFKQYPELGDNIITDLRNGNASKGEVALRREDGKKYILQYHIHPFVTERGKPFALVTALDNSRDHFIRSELERLAWRCSLTNLYNRSYFNRTLEHCQQGYLILIDLRGFKRFNDAYGHDQGDNLLIEMARRLRSFAEIYGANQVARVGSDEFALFINEVKLSFDIKILAHKLLAHLSQVLKIGREQVTPKPALAVVNLAEVLDVMSPMTCVDIAVQHAKRKQGQSIQFFTKDLLSNFQNDTDIERELQLAIRGRQFELYYQPLMDLQEQRYIGAEALIRWHHPSKGILYPNSFIDIAEQTGLIASIGAWVLEASCRQLNLWQHKGLQLSMHVNVSARQFFSGNLFEQVWHLMTRYHLAPRTLILEITETELMEDIKYATNLCKELTELGVGLAIDDFGTGYSSMRYLKQFPISKLKIDRSFISDISSSRESREIVSAIIAMAKALNISLTAEGVETTEQEAFLAANLCHQAQGFLYSPALRDADFTDFIKNHRLKPVID
ncbi:EAL domain-containing protein [Shewanella sp. NIFS-20-20]|uniref:sensor domain-containing phosphodiesterase n=1 Tax=Shewanella sp. NIFS-20-20 TaxID=2853806 RepID=UPI001C4477CC|nr:EAL domain-containing protein [Shewanella sp. NIFS-20-20]